VALCAHPEGGRGRHRRARGASPALPEVASWIEAARRPVLMRTDRATEELGWTPQHTAKQTLRATVDAFRAA